MSGAILVIGLRVFFARFLSLQFRRADIPVVSQSRAPDNESWQCVGPSLQQGSQFHPIDLSHSKHFQSIKPFIW